MLDRRAALVVGWETTLWVTSVDVGSMSGAQQRGHRVDLEVGAD
jgi:hypothetical protein